MKKNHVLGGILALIAGVMGIAGHFVLFFRWYVAGMSAESAEPGCEILLKYIHPGLGDLGILASVLLLVSAYGFFTRRTWAYLISVIGIVLALLASFFVNIPFMAAGLPPAYFILFFPYLALYFLILRAVGKTSWALIALSVLTGLAYIFCFMNGVASTSRIITIGTPIFYLVVSLHWVSMAGWAVVTTGILISPKEWQRVLGLASGTLELAVGIPLAVVTAQELGRFSLFSLAPIVCLVLVVILVWPGLWQKMTGQVDA
jgi:hypothetical protein